MKTVIVLPAYNEEKYVGEVVRSCREHGFDHVIVVDDGSLDNTGTAAADSGAVVVSHMINRGVGAATQTGLSAARMMGADIAVTMDADGQHLAGDIKPLLEILERDRADIVLGSRFLNSKNRIPLLRRGFNLVANLITFMLSGIYISDSQSGMKVFSGEALARINITSNGYEFCSEIIREARYFRLRISEVPISVNYSDYTLSKGQNFASGITTVFKLMLRTLMR